MLAASRKAIISTASKATYATAATANGLKVSSTSNGVKVATSEEPGQTASLAVVVGGGARAETSKNAGVAHFLKNYAFKNSTDRTSFRITREAELAGGVLSANLSRESLVFSAEFLKEDVELFADILTGVVTKQKFQEHEFIDVAHQTAGESANAYGSAQIRAIEAAHQTAFRTGLGHSIFAKPTAHIKNGTVQAFAQQLFSQGNVALVSTGLDHALVESLAEKIELKGTSIKTDRTRYFGGESRIESTGSQYVIAFEGAAADSQEFAALEVLRVALESRLSTGLAFNLGYSDAGLFGLSVEGQVEAAVEELRAVLTVEDFAKAAARARLAATDAYGSRLDRLERLGAQALQTGQVVSPLEAAALIEKVTADDVAKVAEKLLKSKATTVAIGDLSNLPYADSLSL